MREANLIVNDVPKQHCDQPSSEGHTIQDLATGLKIQLKLEGIFSGFCTRRPTEGEMRNGIVIPITPEGISWDPNSLHFAHNEDTMVDVNGELVLRTKEDPMLIDKDEIISEEHKMPWLQEEELVM